jgi:Ca2+-binding RTX toxin-like protein
MATVTGTDNSETIDGADGVTNSADTILGLGGNDTIFGLGGNDTIKGGGGADTINGGSGIDTVSYADSAGAVKVSLGLGRGDSGDAYGDEYISIENITGSQFSDFLYGGDGANVIIGGGGHDYLAGGGGADTLDGGADNDTFTGGDGADTIDGGSGSDTVRYADSDVGIWVSLRQGKGDLGTADGDVLTSIENVVGSPYADIIGGTDGRNVLEGGAGNDFIMSDGGADTLDGGSGHDIASYQGSDAVNIDLRGQNTGGNAQGDVLISIEEVRGSTFDDTLEGSDSADVLKGSHGDDIVFGAGGNDTLYGSADYGTDDDFVSGGEGNDAIYGGGGADLLEGEGGRDSFYFDIEDAGDFRSDEADEIIDFESNEQIFIDAEGAAYAFAGEDETPAARQYSIWFEEDTDSFVLRWRNDDTSFHDVLVYGDTLTTANVDFV